MNGPTSPDADARRGAARYAELVTEYVNDWWDNDNDENLPTNHSEDYYIRVMCYGGGPAGGIEFKVTADQADWMTAHAWHQEWGSQVQYFELEDDIAAFLWEYLVKPE